MSTYCSSPSPPMVSPRQSLGILYTQRLWQLNLQSERNKNTFRWDYITTLIHVFHSWSSRHSLSLSLALSPPALTFALEALAEQTSEKPLAVLTHRGPRVRVHGERVRHLHLAHQDLVQMDRPARVEAPRVAGGPWLAEQKDHQLHFVWVKKKKGCHDLILATGTY